MLKLFTFSKFSIRHVTRSFWFSLFSDDVHDDNITQKDVNIAIIVSVIVTAAVVLIVVGIIAYFCRHRQSFDPSRKFEMDTRSPLKT